jgi:ketosteroid isomerase-like protein
MEWIMYYQIVKRIVRQGFENVNDGNYDALLSQCMPDVVHIFPGDYALGGERHDAATLRQWFERLGRLMPGFKLEITQMLVTGMPWDTLAVVRWTGRASLANGYQYLNHGVHFLTIRWGRVAKFHVYLDTQETAKMLNCLSQCGITEAVAAPIVS